MREGYLELAERDGWIVVDGSYGPNEVATVIDERVAHLPW
jgi:thymidylate kinase